MAELFLEFRERAKKAENVVRIERAASADTATIFLLMTTLLEHPMR